VQMVDIRPLFNHEMSKGKPSGPVRVSGWPENCDPRFWDPINPLYDPAACRDTDWRSKLDIVSYLRFSDYIAHKNGMQYRYVIESEENENIFNVSSLSLSVTISNIGNAIYMSVGHRIYFPVPWLGHADLQNDLLCVEWDVKLY